MFKMQVCADNMSALKNKLLQAAAGIADDQVISDIEQRLLNNRASIGVVEVHKANAIVNEAVDKAKAHKAEQILTLTPVPAAPVSPSLEPQASPLVASAGETGERDSRGMPWDERIHSSSKAKNKDGTWRTARGKDADYIAEIEGELLGKSSPVVPTNTSSVSSSPSVSPAPIATPPLSSPTVSPIASSPVAPTIPQTVTQPLGKPAHDFDSFRKNLPMVLTQLIEAGKINQQYIGQLCEFFHVEQLWDVAKSDNNCKMMFNTFVDHGLITKVG